MTENHADKPAPINRRLTDDERELLADLTTWVIAEQTGVTDQAAAEALDELNQKSGLYMQGDNYDVYVKTSPHGHVIVHCTASGWPSMHTQANSSPARSCAARSSTPNSRRTSDDRRTSTPLERSHGLRHSNRPLHPYRRTRRRLAQRRHPRRPQLPYSPPTPRPAHRNRTSKSSTTCCACKSKGRRGST